MPASSTGQDAEQELRHLQALALALQGATPELVGMSGEESAEEQMARQLQQLDALDSELAAFERRFASADPEVKRMLAHMLSPEVSSPEMFSHGNGSSLEPYFPVATPTSSDSAQTFPIAGGQHPSQNAALSICNAGTDFGHQIQATHHVAFTQSAQHAPHLNACQAGDAWQTAMHEQQGHSPSDDGTAGGFKPQARAAEDGLEASAAMFPAVTPANSLAQQAVHRDSLADCAASLPMPASHPPAVKDTILANQLRHRLRDMEHDMPHMSGSIRETLTHISLSDPTLPPAADRT
eukprot:jgi/Ulvmu1/6232/UM028_0090.1